MEIATKRLYEPVVPADGYRILVDRIWPRGVKKEDLQHDEWLKELAPSTELRRWFNHSPDKWTEFKALYFAELREQKPKVQKLLSEGHVKITLLYGARDEKYNQAIALKAYLEARR